MLFYCYINFEVWSVPCLLYGFVSSVFQLMDLVALDEGVLQFSYGILAASILYHFSDEPTIVQASG